MNAFRQMILEPHVVFLLLPWSAKWPQETEWSPGVPKWRHRAPKMAALGNCSGLKGAGGTGRCPELKMVTKASLDSKNVVKQIETSDLGFNTKSQKIFANMFFSPKQQKTNASLFF